MAFSFEDTLVTEPSDLDRTSLNPDPLSRDIGVPPPPQEVREQQSTFGGQGEDNIAEGVATLEAAKQRAEELLPDPGSSGETRSDTGGGEESSRDATLPFDPSSLQVNVSGPDPAGPQPTTQDSSMRGRLQDAAPAFVLGALLLLVLLLAGREVVT